MNRLSKEYLPSLEEYQSLKHQMMELLSDADLAHTIPGSPSLGELCKEIGETQQSYINSFKPPYTLNFRYRNEDATLAGSVSGLAAWYTSLDKEMKDYSRPSATKTWTRSAWAAAAGWCRSSRI